MRNDTELVYLGRRASEERSAATSSGNMAAREIHLELALAYEFRIHLLRQQEVRQPDPEAPLIARPEMSSTKSTDVLNLEPQIICI
jgi:hypothetical protein